MATSSLKEIAKSTPRNCVRIFLKFSPEQTDTHRARLRYAFSLFCAIHGHQPILASEQADSADVWISYSPCSSQPNRRPVLELGNLYRVRPLHEPAPPPTKFRRGGEETVVFYPPPPDRHPDWLGEVFEWVSSADEYSITARTPIGTTPYAASYVARHKLDVRRPYAAIAMRFLQRALRGVVPGCSSEPVSPAPSVRHFVICTHDVDFLPVGPWDSARRLARNVIITALLYKSPMLAMQQAGKLLQLAVGKGDPLDQLPCLVPTTIQRGLKASYYFLARRCHRRDGNYQIDDPRIVEMMRFLERQGMEVGVHGSYTSLDEAQGLAAEFARLRELGFRAEGGRQHRLRFTLDRLIPALEGAKALYDSSLGWNECIGFRGSACFPFPLYDFEHERPTSFLEIPMVLMEGSLLAAKVPEEDWYNHVSEMLAVSRRYGWGGIALLWHPTAFGGGQYPSGVGELFWKLVDQRDQWQDTWTSASEFVHVVRQRYVEAGLLPPASPE